MNEELQKQLAGIISDIVVTVQKTANFTLAQLPDIVTQYVAYGRVTATLLVSSFLILFLVFLAVFLKYGVFRKDEPGERSWSKERLASCWLGALGSSIGFIGMLANISDLILVWVAPKVWLIKAFTNLVK